MIVTVVRFRSKLPPESVQARFEDRADRYRQVPGAQTQLIPGAGHSPNVEKPDLVAPLILAFAKPSPAPKQPAPKKRPAKKKPAKKRSATGRNGKSGQR